MKLSKLAFLLGLLIVSTTAFAQYDDDETVQSRKSTHKKEKVSAPKASKESKKMKQQDNFKSSVNKTTHLSKKEQAKLQAKKQKEHEERYQDTRERTQNKKTVKRMKQNEKNSYRYNSQKGKSWNERKGICYCLIFK